MSILACEYMVELRNKKKTIDKGFTEAPTIGVGGRENQAFLIE